MVEVPLSPKLLGLPYDFWRPHQRETLQQIVDSDKRFVFLLAPTGSGKSVQAMALIRLAGSGYILVKQRNLQTQYEEAFPNQLASVWGRRHYPCLSATGATADDSFCSIGLPCPEKPLCPYYLAREKAIQGPITTTNYSYFLNFRLRNKVGHRDWMVLDEGDLAEDIMVSFLNVVVYPTRLRERLADRPFNFRESYPAMPNSEIPFQWREWGQKVYPEVKDRFPVDVANYPIIELKRIEATINLIRSLTKVEDSWVGDKYVGKTTRISLRPLWGTQFMKAFYSYSSRVLIMSATLIGAESLARLFGLEPKDCLFLEMPSSFPVQYRPCYVYPIARMGMKDEDVSLPKIASAVKIIMGHYPLVKGILHSVSNKIRDYLVDTIDDPRLYPLTLKNRLEGIQHFKGSPEPLVLVSPSIGRGLDLPGIIKFQCHIKCPWLDLGDKITKLRMQADPDWYQIEMVKALCQQYGRGSRGPEPEMGHHSFILDANFPKFYAKGRKWYPQWFSEALVWPR